MGNNSLNNDAVLLCEVDSVDMWVKVGLKLDGDLTNKEMGKIQGLEAELEMKIDRTMRGEEFKHIL